MPSQKTEFELVVLRKWQFKCSSTSQFLWNSFIGAHYSRVRLWFEGFSQFSPPS